jgi:hypothetical protein
MLIFVSMIDRSEGTMRCAFVYADGAAQDVISAVNSAIDPEDDTPPDLICYIGEMPAKPGVYPCTLYGIPAELVLRDKSDDMMSLVSLKPNRV